MNSTLKSICGLLRNGDPELQLASIRVLGAIGLNDSGVYKSLGELLLVADDPVIFAGILDVIEASPHEQSLKYLLTVIETNPEHDEQVLSAIANIGGKAVPLLKRHYERSSSQIKRKLVVALPRIRSTQAHSFFVECCFSSDHEVVRQAVHSLREEVRNYDNKQKSDLYGKLAAALGDRRLKSNEAALSAIIIAMGILADARSLDKLLPFVDRKYPTQIRRHALMSLARLEYVGGKHSKICGLLFPVLNEADYEGLVRHAVSVLVRIKPSRSDNSRIQALLDNRHPGVVVYAIQALSQLSSITNAEKVLEFMGNHDIRMRDAAAEALRNMPDAVTIILRHLDEVGDRNRAFEMVKILESHGNRIKPDQAREMVKHMISLHERDDEHYQLYHMALRHLRGDVLQSELVKISEKAAKKKDFATIRDTLKLLDHTELLTSDIRFQLAIAKLKTSKKDRSRAFRLSDYCLEHMAHLLREDPKGFKRKFMAEKSLEAEDFLYVGFHFAERLNEERRFGVDLLRHVVKKWPRSQAGKVAKKKLSVEGH